MAVALRWKKSGSAKALPDHCALNSPGLSCYPTGYCEIAPQGRFLALRAQGAVASLRTMTRQAVQRCTSALLPLNYPVHGAQGRRYSQICKHARSAMPCPSRQAPAEIATSPRSRNDKSGVITVLTGACTSRQRCAGSGMPLPYNSGCGRRNCFKICNCQWRSGSAATDAIGLYVFVGSPFESAAVRRAGLSSPIQHLTILRRPYFTYAARNCRVRSFFGWRNSSSGVPDSATTPRSRKMT